MKHQGEDVRKRAQKHSRKRLRHASGRKLEVKEADGRSWPPADDDGKVK